MRPKIAILIVLLSVGRAAVAAETPKADFNRQVRPLLSEYCLKCHGPDKSKREANLRLDQREAALAKTDSDHLPIVPGKPDESEIIRRIFSNDSDEVMPPPAANKKLTDAQKAILKQWVADGAAYDPHWAFAAPRQSPVPTVKNSTWSRNEIDRFILARLEAEGLTPSPPADRYTLVRRLYLDLIGIPPTPEEADQFANDPSSDAYERLVDRLLASPHYGERWARIWLDLARYGDTNGFVEDRKRSIWPYRDWVIKALNADMPFDQFTIEQIAGDMLANPTASQRIATGFHRNTMLNEEAGIDPLEFRFYSMIDRVNTTATTWLGLTLGCAQCHTHKYDPIPQRDYYRFFALMNNTEDLELEVPDDQQIADRKDLESQITAAENALQDEFPLPKRLKSKWAGATDEQQKALRRENLEQHFEAWREEAASRAVHWTTLRPVRATSNLPILTILDDDSVLARGDQTTRDTYDIELSSELRGITALRLDAIPDERLPSRGPGRAYYDTTHGDFFLSELTLKSSGKLVPFKRAMPAYVETKIRKGTLNGKTGAIYVIDGKPETGWSVADRIGQPSAAVFEFETPLADARGLKMQLLFEICFAGGLGRFRISTTTDPIPKAILQVPSEIERLLTMKPESLTADGKQQLLQYYLSVAPELAKQNAQIAKLRGQLPQLSPTTMALVERPSEHTRLTYLHRRGEFLQTADLVEPGSLSILPEMPVGTLRNRLTLAKWLVDPANPLVGRVTMNRQWAALFGQGLVRTLDDFGYQGAPPTHPELLDWLAVEFIRRGWSVKQMHRLMVTSATYQQSSKMRDDLFAKDPQNKLLGRANRYRLQGEQIRDAALQASGLLSRKIGGPSVFPPQPTGVTTEATYSKLEWKESEGPDRYRRGLYTFAKRMAPFAMYNLFDVPNGTVCVARREVSNTPLQSLTLLNDIVFVEAAQALGRYAAETAGSPRERAALVFRRCLTRLPSDKEINVMAAFYEKQKQRIAAGELVAAELSGVTEGNAIEIAAWTTVARAILNLDEAINKE